MASALPRTMLLMATLQEIASRTRIASQRKVTSPCTRQLHVPTVTRKRFLNFNAARIGLRKTSADMPPRHRSVMHATTFVRSQDRNEMQDDDIFDSEKVAAYERLVASGESEGEARMIAKELVQYARRMSSGVDSSYSWRGGGGGGGGGVRGEDDQEGIIDNTVERVNKWEDEKKTRENFITILNKALEERLCRQTPLQYIIGEWDFLDLKGIRIRRPCLCPRPETEELAQMIISEYHSRLAEESSSSSPTTFRVLEIGSGTGALGLAILHSWVHATKIQHVHLTAIDLSDVAAKLTVENAEMFGLANFTTVECIAFAEFCQRFEGGGEGLRQPEQRYDLIVSNPPYIPTDEVHMLESVVKDHEDHRALDGGKEGMDLITDIIEKAPDLLNEQGELWMEVDPRHPKMIRKLLDEQQIEEQEGGIQTNRKKVFLMESFKDFMDNMRFVKLGLK